MIKLLVNKPLKVFPILEFFFVFLEKLIFFLQAFTNADCMAETILVTGSTVVIKTSKSLL